MFSVKQVAKKLNCSESFVRARIAEGSLRHYRLGPCHGGIRVSQEQIDEYLAARERGGRKVTKTTAPPPPARLKHLSLD